GHDGRRFGQWVTFRDQARHRARRRAGRGHLRAQRDRHDHLLRIGASGRGRDAPAHRGHSGALPLAGLRTPGTGVGLRLRRPARLQGGLPVVRGRLGLRRRRVTQDGGRAGPLRLALRGAGPPGLLQRLRRGHVAEPGERGAARVGRVPARRRLPGGRLQDGRLARRGMVASPPARKGGGPGSPHRPALGCGLGGVGDRPGERPAAPPKPPV
ncbi:MAG: Acetyltransferase, GNAT family, partial [uncultured Rubrobacteraceae bacterium]